MDLDENKCQGREGALIVNILYGIMIYCLPSMALTAWLLFRLELRAEENEQTTTLEIPHNQAKNSAPAGVNFR